MATLVYYVSGHGFGHAVRSAEIIRALQRDAPELQIHLRTTAPDWLFPAVSSYSPVNLDVGVIQPDALHTDGPATLRAVAAQLQDENGMLRRELAFLDAHSADCVLADIPSLAFSVAAARGIPSVGIANFSWDWIYGPFVREQPEYQWIVERLREQYSRCTLLLRLPFFGDLSAFPEIEDVPLVVRKPSAQRATLRKRLALPADRRTILLGFGGLGLASLSAHRLAKLSEYLFLATEKDLAIDGALPENVRLFSSRQANYDDLLAAVDGVVGKPGFGMVASCLVNGTPFLYTDRGEFPEYPILVAALHAHGRAAFIPRDELTSGNLGPYLRSLFEQTDREARPRNDGAQIIARRLLRLMRRPAASTVGTAPAPEARPAH